MSMRFETAAWARGSAWLVGWLGCFCCAAAAWGAGYNIRLTSDGERSAFLQPGHRLSLDVAFDSGGLEFHNSVIFYLVISGPGLVLERYEWSAPYATGGVDDDSHPAFGELPMRIDAESFSAPGLPSGRIDAQFSNALFPQAGQAGRFGDGVLLRLTVAVPADYQGPDVVSLGVEADTVADGFRVIPVVSGEPFELRIVPGFIGDEAGDEDGDGISNLVAYALNLGTASTPGERPPLMTETSPGLPLFGVELKAGAPVFTFTFWKDLSKMDIRYEIQVSDDLVVWTAVEDQVIGLHDASEMRQAEILMSEQKQFIRLAISRR